MKKALYGLKQAPRQWYERLSNFLLSHGYERGMIDKTISSSRSQILKLSLCKSMLMTSSLVLHKTAYVKNLLQLCKVSLKCL